MKNLIRENRSLLLFVFLFGVFRTAIADWNPIPSGSMRPNLLEGDVVFVNRIAYDLKLPLTDRILIGRLGEPRHGDVVTFSSPGDGTRLIKRIVALPGDVVEMRDKQLVINGVAADYAATAAVEEKLDDGRVIQALQLQEAIGVEQRTVQWYGAVPRSDNFPPLRIPADHFLMLGDNRDNSGDSRRFGLVPRHLLIGRAERVLVSLDYKDSWLPRIGRFGHSLRR